MAALVLVILLCFALGLTCGCYGKRPADPYDDEFGTKATGASCLMASVLEFFFVFNYYYFLPSFISVSAFSAGFTLLGFWNFVHYLLFLLGFTEFYQVLLGFTGFYWVLLGLTWSY